MLAGPGAISLVIILMEKYGSTPAGMAGISAGIGVVIGIAFVIFTGGSVISKIMGEKGARAFTRVMGLLVTAFAIQYILDGISAYFGV
jgi:multiple antibiotic resistance protein